MQSFAIRVLGFGLGGLMLFHGVDKIMHGTAFIEQMLNGYHLPYAQYASYGVYIGEVVAPLLLILGLCMRFAGAIIAFNMAVAIFLVHQNDLLTLGEHGSWSIEVPVLYLIAGLTIALSSPLEKKNLEEFSL